MTTATASSTRTQSRTEDGNQDKFLTFCLGREEYGLPILAVDGQIVSSGLYPTRAQLAQKLGLVATADKPRFRIPVVGGCEPGSGCC